MRKYRIYDKKREIIAISIFCTAFLLLSNLPSDLIYLNVKGERNLLSYLPYITQNKPINYTGNTGYEPCYYYIGGIINSANGNLYLSEADIAINARGFQIEIIRSYNSHMANYDCGFGYGWTFNYNINLTEQLDGSLTLLEGDGSLHTFENLGGGAYSSPPGKYYKLRKNPDSTYLLQIKDGSSYSFNATGRIMNITDKNGNKLTFTYLNGKLVNITDDTGLWITLGYNINGRVATIRDTLGREIEYKYNTEGELINVTDVMGNSTLYEYHTNHLLKAKIDKIGRVLTFDYITLNNLTRVKKIGNSIYNYSTGSYISPYYVYDIEYDIVNETVKETKRGREYIIELNLFGNPLKIIDPRGYDVQYSWGDNMNLISYVNKNSNTYTFSYDDYGNIVEMMDPMGYSRVWEWENIDNDSNYITLLKKEINQLGFTINYTYDENGNLNKTEDAIGQESYFYYDSYGNLIKFVDVTGNQTIFEYNDAGYPVNITNALGNVTTFVYDGVGRVVKIIDANGHITNYQYDDNDRIIKVTNALGYNTTYHYDALGNLLYVIDFNGNRINYTYNFRNQITNVTDTVDNEIRYDYDKFGNLIKIIDAEGNESKYSYDEIGRVVSVTDEFGFTEYYSYDANDNVISYTDKNGYTTTYTYDALNRLIQITDALGGVTTYEYDPLGNIINFTNANGYTTTYTYDALNRLIQITDALGNKTNYVYDAVGNLIKVIDARGYNTTYTYDALNRLIQITDALGNKTNYVYDAVGNLIKVIDDRGYNTTYTYDALNRLIQITDALGGVTTYEYDPLGNIINFTNANGYTTTYTYDALNRLIQITDSEGNSSYYTYDAMGNLQSYTDFRGYATTYSYDALNRLISISDATGNSTYYTYDAMGNLISITNSRGYTTTYSYDALNRLTSITDALGNTESYSYDAVGNLINFTDARGYTTTYSYDALNRLTSITDALGHIISYSYDAVGNRISSINKNGYMAKYEYDALNRLIKWTDALNHSIYYSYDAVGNKIRITDANGISTDYIYNGNNQLISIIDATDNMTNYSYDSVGNLIQIVDPKGGIYSYEYDSLNRIINFSLPTGKSITYSYDENGNVIRKILPNLNQINYSYDSLNRLTQISYPDGNSISYYYDSVGNLVSAINTNGIGDVMIMYDANNNVISVETDYGLFTKSIIYTYDEVGNIINITDETGSVTHYEYDAMNRVISITDPSGIFQFEYDNMSNRISLIYPNDMSVSYIYDEANRLINQTLRNSTNEIINYYTYTYDNLTNKISIDEIGGATTFQYDFLYRIVNVTYPSGSFVRYTYDAVGNRLSKKESGKPAIIYTYDVDNRLLQQGNTSYSYDECGNLINKTSPAGTIFYTYDCENRLIHVDNVGGTQVFYNYSSLGERIEKTNGSGNYYYLYNGIDILAELDVSGNQIARYTHTPVIDETLCMIRNNTPYFFDMDGLMNVRQIFNDSEILKASYEYDAFGVIVQQTAEVNNPYCFTGREWDTEAGLYYYRNRYYDAEIGRFITQDPMGLKGGINLYAYVNNNPINFIDPFGLETKSTRALEEKIKELEQEIKSAEEALEEVNEEIEELEEDIEKLAELIDALGKEIEKQRGEYPEKAAKTLKKAWDIVSAFMPPTPKSLIELIPDVIEFLGSPVDPGELGVPGKVATINWNLLPKLEEAMKNLDEKYEDQARIIEYIGELKNELDSLKLQLENEKAKEKNDAGGGGASDSGPHRPSGPPKKPPVPTGRGGRNPFPPMPIPQPSPKPPKAPPKPSGEKKPRRPVTGGGKEKRSAKDEIDVPDWSDLEEPILPGEIDWPISSPKPPKAPPKPSGEKKPKSVPTPKSKLTTSTEIIDPTDGLIPKVGIHTIHRRYKEILKGKENLYFISWNDAGIKNPNIHNGDYRNVGNDTLNVTVQNNGDYNITFLVNFTLERWGTYPVEVINESFEEIFPPPGWQIYHLGNGNTWMQTNWPHTGNYSATTNTTIPPPPIQNYNEWLITNSYNLSKVISPMLSLWYFAWSSTGIFNSDLQIWASIDGGNMPQDFINNGTLLTDIDTVPAMTWINEFVNLSSLQGEGNVHLAFVLSGEEYDFIEFYLDDIIVEGFESGWVEVDSESKGPYEIDPDIWIESFFDVFYDIEGEYRATFSLDNPVRRSWSDDQSDNDVYQATYMVVNDTTSPYIANVTANPSIQDVGGYVNITCDVIDNIAVNEVRINITYPDESKHNFSMNEGYYFNQTYSMAGIYYYFVWANDVFNNSNFSSTYNFTITQQPSIDYIILTFETKNEIYDCNISTNLSFNVYASAFNNTFGFIEFVDANWSILNYGTNATINATQGKNILFSSGWNDGLAILTAEYNGCNDSVVFTINSSLFSFILYKGWNLITLPVENEYNASSLYQDINECSIILSWNASIQDFIIYVPGSPYDFAIEDGHGYFIGMKNDSIFSLAGIPIQTVNITLSIGWNMLGWFKQNETTADSLLNSIQGCNIVLRWNASIQDFELYVPGANDFVITRGDGFLIAVTE
ncbi:MAG TPA: hypothetical protein ENI33_04410, partial [Thermoplasmatales archaeon]|nr:hypothetical protein [Thermoplasmatales archaeon]